MLDAFCVPAFLTGALGTNIFRLVERNGVLFRVNLGPSVPVEKEVEEARTQCKQEESQNERLKILHKQLNLLLSEKVKLSQKLEYLRDRTEYTTGKLSSRRDLNLSDQKEDQSRVRGKIARMSTRRKPTTRKIPAREPDWKLQYK